MPNVQINFDLSLSQPGVRIRVELTGRVEHPINRFYHDSREILKVEILIRPSSNSGYRSGLKMRLRVRPIFWIRSRIRQKNRSGFDILVSATYASPQPTKKNAGLEKFKSNILFLQKMHGFYILYICVISVTIRQSTYLDTYEIRSNDHKSIVYVIEHFLKSQTFKLHPPTKDIRRRFSLSFNITWF